MTELKHTDLDAFLLTRDTKTFPQAVLIWGNDFLCRQVFDSIVNHLLNSKEKALCYELLEGEEAMVPKLVERLTTYSFMTDKLVLAVKQVGIAPNTGSPAYTSDDVSSLEMCVENGFPDGHFLILTTASMDKRRTFYKTFKDKGLAVDCTVPEGSRQADLLGQDALMRKTLDKILQDCGKTMDRAGVQVLFDRIGFDPQGLAENLQKLVSYTGDRRQITREDVLALVKRTRKDAIYELTNAIGERDASKALQYAKSLLDAGFHPLQMLTALANMIRRLIVVRQFIDQSNAGQNQIWIPGYDYNRFRKTTLPGIIESDLALQQTLENWGSLLGSSQADGQKKNKKPVTDLFIAPNPKNTYPVYHTFLKADHFSMAELIEFLIDINQVDRQLKSTGPDPSILLDDLIIRLCSTRSNP